MSDYQKVETVQQEDMGQPFSEEDINNLEQEASAEGQEEQPNEERPSWLPEKFESAEDMAKAYEELQAQYTKDRQSSEEREESSEKAAGNLEPLSVNDFSQFNEEFAETGDISDESREKIEGWGIPREMIDGYIEGQKAVLDNHFNNVYSEVGGQENYTEMIDWAADTLPEGEQEAFNQAVMNGNTDQMMFAVRSLASRWRSETGNAGKPLIQGSTGSTGAQGGFRSLAELTAAMKDPRYNKDAAYRKDIETRLANSDIL